MFLEAESLTGLELEKQDKLAGQGAKGVCLPLLLHFWDYKSAPPCLTFMWVQRSRSGPHGCVAGPLSVSPALQMAYFTFPSGLQFHPRGRMPTSSLFLGIHNMPLFRSYRLSTCQLMVICGPTLWPLLLVLPSKSAQLPSSCVLCLSSRLVSSFIIPFI